MSEMVANFHFLRPAWLALLPVALLLTFLLWRMRGREASWVHVVSPQLLPHLISERSIARSRSGLPALCLAWCLGTVAAAGPSWVQLPQPVLQKQDALVLVLDLSYSMLATDLQPSRQDRVRRKLLDLLNDRDEGLTALIAYAGDAHIVAPLTDDNPTIANLLPALSPQMMPLPGSNPVEAVELALELLDSAGVRSGRILLITDGVDASDARSIGTRLESGERRLAVLGVGTEVGAPIALPGGGFLRDDGGEIVVPALNEAPLKTLADLSGGRYERLRVDDRDLDALLEDPLLPDNDDTVALDRRADQWQDMAHWLLLPILVIALLSFRRGWVYLLPFCVLILPSEESQAFEWQDLWLRADQQGLRALERGDPETAATLFKNDAWRGTAAYSGEDYDTAVDAFGKLETADGLYNLGNALAGQNRLDEAIDAYQRSLELQPGQEDARRNIETLEKLREQQQQQQQSQQGDPNQQPQDQQGQDGDSESQQQQDQQQSSDQQGGSQNDQQGQNGENSEPSSDPQNQDRQDESESEESQGDAEQSEQQGAQGTPQPQIDNSAMQEDMERDQAMQQWLRRVPDDPSGLLREKFRYESRLRQQQGKNREPKKIW